MLAAGLRFLHQGYVIEKQNAMVSVLNAHYQDEFLADEIIPGTD